MEKDIANYLHDYGILKQLEYDAFVKVLQKFAKELTNNENMISLLFVLSVEYKFPFERQIASDFLLSYPSTNVFGFDDNFRICCEFCKTYCPKGKFFYIYYKHNFIH